MKPKLFWIQIWWYKSGTVKLGFKELLNEEHIGNREPFSVTNLPVYLINSEKIGISEQLTKKFLNAKLGLIVSGLIYIPTFAELNSQCTRFQIIR